MCLAGKAGEFTVIGAFHVARGAGTLGGQQPGASWGANGFQEPFGKESHTQPKQNTTSGTPCPERSAEMRLKALCELLCPHFSLINDSLMLHYQMLVVIASALGISCFIL